MKVFFIKIGTFFFRHDTVACLLDYSIVSAFICTGKPATSVDSLYCNICCIVVAGREPTLSPEACPQVFFHFTVMC